MYIQLYGCRNFLFPQLKPACMHDWLSAIVQVCKILKLIQLYKCCDYMIHITNNTAIKATRMLNYLKCHHSKCSTDVKVYIYISIIYIQLAYNQLLLIQPMMEYACIVCMQSTLSDTIYLTHASSFQLQCMHVRKGPEMSYYRWALSDYNYTTVVYTAESS